MTTLNTKLRKFIISSAVGATMSLPAFADTNLQPLGSLSAENGVTVISETGKLPIENTYSYFGGDVIVTGDKGLAGLTLGNDGGVYVSRNSSATVRKVNGEYVVELEKGSVGFSFEAGVPFKVTASGKVIQSATGQEAVSGAVELNAKGQVAVRSMHGGLQTIADSGQRSTIGAGEIYAMSEGEGRLIKAQNVEEDDDDSGAIWPWVVGGALGVWAIVELTDSDSSSSKDTGGGDTGGGDTGGGDTGGGDTGDGGGGGTAGGGGGRPTPPGGSPS